MPPGDFCASMFGLWWSMYIVSRSMGIEAMKITIHKTEVWFKKLDAVVQCLVRYASSMPKIANV
jgi:hypothetical protein